MATDLTEQVVSPGSWLYAGLVPKKVEVVRLSHDYYFDLPAIDGRSEWTAHPPAEDGFYYYVRADGGDFLGSPPFGGTEAAQAWANAQPWGPIAWS